MRNNNLSSSTSRPTGQVMRSPDRNRAAPESATRPPLPQQPSLPDTAEKTLAKRNLMVRLSFLRSLSDEALSNVEYPDHNQRLIEYEGKRRQRLADTPQPQLNCQDDDKKIEERAVARLKNIDNDKDFIENLMNEFYIKATISINNILNDRELVEKILHADIPVNSELYAGKNHIDTLLEQKLFDPFAEFQRSLSHEKHGVISNGWSGSDYGASYPGTEFFKHDQSAKFVKIFINTKRYVGKKHLTEDPCPITLQPLHEIANPVAFKIKAGERDIYRLCDFDALCNFYKHCNIDSVKHPVTGETIAKDALFDNLRLIVH